MFSCSGRKLVCATVLAVCAAAFSYAAECDTLRTSRAYGYASCGKPQVFGMFRTNYIAPGIPLGERITRSNADVSFQISLRLQLFTVKDTYIFATYTQKCFWDVFEESLPFRDTNFNPGLWCSTPVAKSSRWGGLLFVGVEHESNGRGGDASRSWNYVTAAYMTRPWERWQFELRLWGGYYDRKGNPDWFRYRGFGLVAATYSSLDERFIASAAINPSNRFRNWNVRAEFMWRFSKRDDRLPYLFVQYRCGYCENMLEYNRWSSIFRVGIAIRPRMLNMY